MSDTSVESSTLGDFTRGRRMSLRNAMLNKDIQTLLDLSQQLLTAIDKQDWSTYSRLCVDDLTSFEPEGRGSLIPGLQFHKYYFGLSREEGAPGPQSTICSPDVRVMGHVAIVTYIRLVQTGTATSAFEETRVWEKDDADNWVHVHFHRSLAETRSPAID